MRVGAVTTLEIWYSRFKSCRSAAFQKVPKCATKFIVSEVLAV